jgi:Domain of unknown function (DUF4919)
MIKTFITTILIITTFSVFGQETFNYQTDVKNILAKTKDEKDNLYYEKLLKRYDVNDTTLTNFEILSLLIGYTDKKEYKPYEDLDMEREIYKLNGEGKFQEGLDKGLTFIKTHPFSVKTLFEIGYSYHKLNNEDKADFYVYKGQKIFEAMFFSGSGTTQEKATFALGPADGQDYIRKFIGAKIGIMGSGKDKYGNFLDILETKFEDGKTGKLYFIIQHATNKMFSSDDMNSFENELKKLKKSDKTKKKKN